MPNANRNSSSDVRGFAVYTRYSAKALIEEHRQLLSQLSLLRAQPDYSRAKIRMFMWSSQLFQGSQKSQRAFGPSRLLDTGEPESVAVPISWSPPGSRVTLHRQSTANQGAYLHNARRGKAYPGTSYARRRHNGTTQHGDSFLKKPIDQEDVVAFDAVLLSSLRRRQELPE